MADLAEGESLIWPVKCNIRAVSYCIDAEARFNMSVEHKSLMRQGQLWPELREIIRQENSDLIIVATHGRHRIRKLFFGSVDEQIFRRADCPVLTFGPHSHERAMGCDLLCTPNVPFCYGFRAGISPRIAPGRCGCESTGSKTCFSNHPGSHSAATTVFEGIRIPLSPPDLPPEIARVMGVTLALVLDMGADSKFRLHIPR